MVKWSLISDVVSIFDPLELLGSVFVVAKVMIQQSWDKELPDNLEYKWSKFRDIPRFLLDKGNYTAPQFC